MESASIATIAAVNNVQSLVLRSISDQADGEAPKHFLSFLRTSADKVANFLVSGLPQILYAADIE